MKLRSLPGAIAIAILTVIIAPANVSAQAGCCAVRGNTDCSPDGVVDISDLTRLIDNMFISLGPLCCPEAGNIDADPGGLVDIADLTRLIDNMFISLNPVEPCGGSTLTFAQRQVVFNALDSVATAIEGASADSVAGKLAAFLASRPEIDSAGIIDGVSVWAWFTDGRIISIPNNREPTGSGSAYGDPNSSELETKLPVGFVIPTRRQSDWDGISPMRREAITQSTADGDNFEIPYSVQAHVISTLNPPCFTIGAPIVKSLLEGHGYVVVPSNGSVSSLMNVHGDGVFFMDAHGGSCLGKDGAMHLAVWTGSYFTYQLDTAYGPLLNRNELVYMRAPDKDPFGQCTAHWRFAYTGRFVAQYMDFAPGAFVMINACQTDSVPSLRQGFFTAGASVFAGWSKIVHDPGANRAAEFLFDRMLGSNVSAVIPPESPPQRPFDVDQLYQDMVSRGYDTDPLAPNAKVRIRRLQHRFGLLAPSIKFLSIDEGHDTLIIAGMFGSDPGAAGRVLVGGNELPVHAWDSATIRASIPNTGAGSSGPVWVEVDGRVGGSSTIKRKSNVVNLTEWRGDLVYKHVLAGTLTGTITVHAHLRADLHGFREIPHETPWRPTVLFDGAQDSYGEAKATGSFTLDYGDGYYSTWNWSGTANVPGMWEDSDDRLELWGSIDPVSRQMVLHIAGSSLPDLDEVYTSNLFPGYSQKFFEYIVSGVTDNHNSDLYLTLTNSFDIPAGQRDTTSYSPYDPYNPSRYELKWNLIQSSFAPDSTAAQ